MSQFDYSRGHVAREEDVLRGELASLAQMVRCVGSTVGRLNVAIRKGLRESAKPRRSAVVRLPSGSKIQIAEATPEACKAEIARLLKLFKGAKVEKDDDEPDEESVEKDDDLDQESVEKALHSLDGTVSRLRGASGQLYRVMERRVEDALDPHAARERKGRPIPRVCKSLTAPTEGRAFIEQAAAAGRAGRLDEFVARHGTFERWSENYRRGAASA